MLGFVIPCQAKKASSWTIYVSPYGNDSNPGTKKKPLSSLEAAWQRAQPVLGQKAVTVYLREGKYTMLQPLVIGGEKTGTKDCPVIIAGYPGEKATLTTSRAWRNLKWMPYRDGIWQVNINLGDGPDRLFVNGQLQQMARYPDYDPSVRILNGYAADALADGRVARWKHPAGGYIHAIHAREWGSVHYLITGKDSLGRLQTEGGFQNNRPMGMHKSFRMVENIFEELDKPGEWFYDNASKTLYYYPAEGIDLATAEVEVPQAESFFVLKGDKEHPVREVHLRNMSLTQTRRTFMKTAEPLLRGDWCIYRGAAVVFEQTEACSIEQCDLSDLGGNAVFISCRNVQSKAYANHIHHIGASAVCFVGSPKAVRQPLSHYGAPPIGYEKMDKTVGPLTDDYPMECTADNNLIHDIGMVEKQVAGVQISMARRITVSHNSIYNTPRAGININDGTWGGHCIEGNDVFNTVLETGDHGAFNSWGRDRFWSASWKAMTGLLKEHKETVLLDAMEANHIVRNRFRCDHGWDIDLDDGSSNYLIEENVCLNGGLKLREGCYRTADNNVILNNTFHPHVWFEGSGDVFRHNIVTAAYRPISVSYWGKEVDYNLFPDSLDLAEARTRGTDAHSAYGNPLFADAERGDYRVAEDSPALKVGFQNFDMQHFGVQVPALKEKAQCPPLPELLFSRSDTKAEKTYSWRGLTLKNVTTEGERSVAGLDAVRGVWVKNAGTNTDGFKEGDVIVRFHGTTVYSWNEIVSKLDRCMAGEVVTVSVMREQKAQELKFCF